MMCIFRLYTFLVCMRDFYIISFLHFSLKTLNGESSTQVFQRINVDIEWNIYSYCMQS